MFVLLSAALLSLSVSHAKPCTDIVCQTGDAQPRFFDCDDDALADAVCGFGGLGWTVALSTEDCEMSEDIIDDATLLAECRPVDVTSVVLNNERKLDSHERKLDLILHNMGLRGPIVENCASDDPWCIHIAESGSTQLDEKFKGSTILKFAHDNVKDWLFQELSDAGLFEENMRDPMQCFEGRKDIKLAKDFHRNCDDLGVFTVTMVRTIEDGSIFGIVSTKPFSGSLKDRTDDRAFQFSLYSGLSGQATGFRLNPRPGRVKWAYNTAYGPRTANWMVGDRCMDSSGQGDKIGVQTAGGTDFEGPATEWEKSHMHNPNPWSFSSNRRFHCENLEVWIVSAASS